MTTVFHARPYSRFIELQSNLKRKKFHKKNQGTNFLGGSFGNRDNVKTSIQFRRERQFHYLKRRFFHKNRPIQFNINITSVIRLVKRNQLSFSSIEIYKPLPAPVHSVSMRSVTKFVQENCSIFRSSRQHCIKSYIKLCN